MGNRRERRGRRRRNPRHRKNQRRRGADFISSMPDEMLHHIISFIPTDLAMRTSVLSKRWRHVWRETPSLNISEFQLRAEGINQTLASYTAPKIKSFSLRRSLDNAGPQIDSWIEFAISRNVEELSVSILDFQFRKSFSFPDFFYLSSSVKQLILQLDYCDMIPRCTVSWKSLRNLSLRRCELGDESFANILSGCPVLESLRFFECRFLERLRLDLSKSLSLRILEIDRVSSGPIEIVAPHIHYLRLRVFSDRQCTLVNVSSLTEANLDIIRCRSEGDLFQTMALEMLAKAHSVDRLTLGTFLLQGLTLAELRGVAFPTLKAQTLIVETEFARAVIPGIQSLLRNSPKLKKLAVHTDMRLDKISDSQGLNPDRWCRSTYEVFPTTKEIWSMLGCNDATSKLLASVMELVLRNAKTLETMVLWLGGVYFKDAQRFKKLLRMVATLSRKNNVSIVLKRSNS
ncbi:unnamed protein product [Microthlaspi erraticum]|uniref:F-box domain-containing protein n=1 Tax=Microthlaspi erraticum TaxID=1685480 RepID=A0A6D2HW17_9BRAS|nr:unnamed protein product [Microthlaspi erraticum]